MDIYLLDWANLLLRWVHVITAIAWIGASFYFVWLDNSLEPPAGADARARGVDGELWAVHGGGFYNPQKYLVAPPQMPQKLHWFYWESYATWLTGFALLTVLYLFNATVFLIDKSVFDWAPSAAVAGALVYLTLGWIFYDIICRGFGQGAGGDRRVGILVALYVVAATWLACQLFAGRAAFVLTGAMIATIMSANVLMVIIPGQRAVMAQMKAGEPVDPIHGQRAKQRSVHNTYFTLPVLIAMLSNHYSMLYQGRQNWLVLVLLMLAGVLIRQFFLLRHKERINWGWWAAGIVVIVGVIVWLAPKPAAPIAGAAVTAVAAKVGYDELKPVLEQRCVLCHGAAVAQKNVRVDTPEEVARHAQQIYQQVVSMKLMPLGNATQMTDAERALVGRWFNDGASVTPR
ncbi:MAG: urate hydroxylase PuuD [Lautropia sp.]